MALDSYEQKFLEKHQEMLDRSLANVGAAHDRGKLAFRLARYLLEDALRSGTLERGPRRMMKVLDSLTNDLRLVVDRAAYESGNSKLCQGCHGELYSPESGS